MSQFIVFLFFFFSSRRRHTRCGRDWSSDVCSSDLDSIITEQGIIYRCWGGGRRWMLCKMKCQLGRLTIMGSVTRLFIMTRVDRKSTRLNSSHVRISYAVFCLKKKKKQKNTNDGHTK